MDCPVCKVELKMSERQGIEIDYCPQCRGVWLDRGELDKIIERAGVAPAAAPPPPPPQPAQPQAPPVQQPQMPGMPPPAYGRPVYGRDPDSDYNRGYGHGGQYHGKHRKKGFLGELFDFD